MSWVIGIQSGVRIAAERPPYNSQKDKDLIEAVRRNSQKLAEKLQRLQFMSQVVRDLSKND